MGDLEEGRGTERTRKTRHGHSIGTLDGGDDTVGRGPGDEGRKSNSSCATHFFCFEGRLLRWEERVIKRCKDCREVGKERKRCDRRKKAK